MSNHRGANPKVELEEPAEEKSRRGPGLSEERIRRRSIPFRPLTTKASTLLALATGRTDGPTRAVVREVGAPSIGHGRGTTFANSTRMRGSSRVVRRSSRGCNGMTRLGQGVMERVSVRDRRDQRTPGSINWPSPRTHTRSHALIHAGWPKFEIIIYYSWNGGRAKAVCAGGKGVRMR